MNNKKKLLIAEYYLENKNNKEHNEILKEIEIIFETNKKKIQYFINEIIKYKTLTLSSKLNNN